MNYSIFQNHKFISHESIFIQHNNPAHGLRNTYVNEDLLGGTVS